MIPRLTIGLRRRRCLTLSRTHSGLIILKHQERKTLSINYADRIDRKHICSTDQTAVFRRERSCIDRNIINRETFSSEIRLQRAVVAVIILEHSVHKLKLYTRICSRQHYSVSRCLSNSILTRLDFKIINIATHRQRTDNCEVRLPLANLRLRNSASLMREISV